MAQVRVGCIGLSVDGFAAGPDQDLEHPLGVGGIELMQWAFATKTFKTMFGQPGGSTGIDENFAARGFENVGAWILGRNMFGPLRGPWPDDTWKGWWGDSPPYHTQVFVLTHHPRASITMLDDTVFHFVTEGIDVALQRARDAAGDHDVRIGGGVATIRQYLEAKLIDELHVAMSPVILGRGEPLFSGLNLATLGYHCTAQTQGEHANHMVLSRKKNDVAS